MATNKIQIQFQTINQLSILGFLLVYISSKLTCSSSLLVLYSCPLGWMQACNLRSTIWLKPHVRIGYGIPRRMSLVRVGYVSVEYRGMNHLKQKINFNPDACLIFSNTDWIRLSTTAQ
jgi:hypothetical protein